MNALWWCRWKARLVVGGPVGVVPTRRKTRIRQVNPERRAAKYLRNFSGVINGVEIHHDKWIRKRPCVVCLRWGSRQTTPTQAAHVIARGMGGANGDWRQLVPLCNNDHREHEKIYTKGILDVYDVDLAKAAAILVAAHLQELGISDDTTPQEAHRQ